MATTLGDLVQEILAQLHSYTVVQEQATTLTSTLSATDLSFTVTDTSQIGRGLVELDDELVHIEKVDIPTATAFIAPWGRGQFGSTADAHTAGARVTRMPRFPRNRVKRMVNQTILALYPDIFAVKSDESNRVNPAQVTYGVPADVETVLEVRYEAPGPSRTWLPVNGWRLDRRADLTKFPTGVSLDVNSAMYPGRTIKVTYATSLTPLSAEADLLSVSGLAESAADIVTMGATGRMLLELENARPQLSAVEQGERSAVVPTAAASNAARVLLAAQANRVEQERRRLRTLYPTTITMRR